MYSYEEEKKWLFTDEGQRIFLKVRDRAQQMYDFSGAVRVGKLMGFTGSGGDSWRDLACVDRLVELGEYRLVNEGGVTQNRILIR